MKRWKLVFVAVASVLVAFIYINSRDRTAEPAVTDAGPIGNGATFSGNAGAWTTQATNSSTSSSSQSVAASSSSVPTKLVSPSEDELPVVSYPKFALSPSLERQCAVGAYFCKSGLKLIEQFEGEERDDAWAGKAESILARAIAKAQSPDHSLRSLECRETLCVAVITAPPPKVMEFDRQALNGVLEADVVYLHGDEVYDGNRLVWLTLRIFHRN